MPDLEQASGTLLPAPPDWSSAVVLSIAIPTTRTRGLTGVEIRTPLGDSLRCKLRWRSVMSSTRWAAIRNLMQEAEDRRWLVPVWPLMRRGADWAGVLSVGAGGVNVAWSGEFTDFTSGSSIGSPTAFEWVAPALVGLLKADARPAGTSTVRVTFELTEDSPGAMALAPGAVSWQNGPALPDATVPKRFPFSAVWTGRQTAGAADLAVVRSDIGDARETVADYRGSSPERPVSGDAVLPSHADAWKFLRWFLDVRGDVVAHYVHTWTEAGRLSASATAGNSYVDVVNASLIGANRYVALLSGQLAEVVRVSTISTNRLNLSASLGASWGIGTTHVALAMLARLAKPEAELEFTGPGVGRASTAWREVPAEYSPVAGETRGSTIGAAPLRVWLYRFIVIRGGGNEEQVRYTNHEVNLDIGEVWTAWAMEHSEIRQTLRLDREEVTVTMRWADILGLCIPGRHDGTLTLEISSVVITAGTPGTPAVIFSGEASKFDVAGPSARVSFSGRGRLFGRSVPRFKMQRGCNYSLFEPRCGLDWDDWRVDAVVVSVSGATVVVGTFTPGGSVPGGWGGAHWLAGGYVQRTTGFRHHIVDNTAKTGGNQITMTLLGVAYPALSIGESITLVAGCDGDSATCKNKFDNLAKFGGFPWIPDRSPSVVPEKRDDAASGKK